MPLKPGKTNIGPNITELEANNYPPKQALAIALREAGEAKPKPKRNKAHKQTTRKMRAHSGRVSRK